MMMMCVGEGLNESPCAVYWRGGKAARMQRAIRENVGRSAVVLAGFGFGLLRRYVVLSSCVLAA